MLPAIIGTVAALLAGGFAFVFTRPNEFRVVRQGFAKAPPEVVFAQVNDLHCWQEWSPWAKLDPNAKLTYSGPREGKDASYDWNGNNKVGEGKLTITESRPYHEIKMQLKFLRPFKCNNDVDFTFKPEGGGTTIIWGMQGKNNLMSKAMCLFMNMDKMVGKDFEKGLASLKVIAEDKSRPQPKSL